MTGHPVEIWTIRLTEPCRECLSSDERERAARFKFDADRVHWTRARSSLRATLARYTNTSPELLVFAYGAHGKPALADRPQIEFNISHAADYALIAVSEGVPVGIDIEKMRPKIDMAAVLRRLGEQDLPSTPEALYQRWTLREAKSKAAGGALFDEPLRQVCAVPLDAPEGYAAAVALVGFTPLPQFCGALPGNR